MWKINNSCDAFSAHTNLYMQNVNSFFDIKLFIFLLMSRHFQQFSSNFSIFQKEWFHWEAKKQNQLINSSGFKFFLWRNYQKMIIMFMQAKDLIFPLINFLIGFDNFWEKIMQKCSHVQILKNFLVHPSAFVEENNLKFPL